MPPFLCSLSKGVIMVASNGLNCFIFRYPKDKKTYHIDEQFMWGSALLFSPCVSQVGDLYMHTRTTFEFEYTFVVIR